MSTEDEVFLRLRKRPFDEVTALFIAESKSEEFRASDVKKLEFFESVGWTAEQFLAEREVERNRRAAEKMEALFAWVRQFGDNHDFFVSTESKDGK